ncbi:MAG: alkaline phosphatase family protein [Planctomycetes bacterium]|nr:alkaline phosphatase family protein [Planctomycetota bacterium]
MAGRVVIFGLDGATYSVLDDLARRGVMPNFARFVSEGARGLLNSTIPPLTPPAWTTLVTGRSPGAHGIFNFLQFESEDSPYLRIISSREIRCETIWSMVSRAGRRAGSFNFVAHSPAPKINGYVIPGWVPYRWVRAHSHPQGIIDRLKNEIGSFDLQTMAMNFQEEEKAVAGTQLHDYEPWIDLHIRREQQWFNCMKHLLVNDPCDLTGIVFDGVDKLQHLVWQFLDPAYEPANPSQDFLRTRERCWDYFRKIDGFLGETVQIVGDDGLVLIASDHGFTGTSEIVYMNTWLEQQGYLTWKGDAAVEHQDSQELGAAHPYHLTHLDMSRTRAYATSASSNGIHIPVKGIRGEHGIDPSDYEVFRDELRYALLNRCVDPATGEQLVTKVWTREEAFAGEMINFAPDFTVALRDHGFFSVLRSDTVLKPRSVVMGCHHPQGIILARGADVRRGAQIDPVSLLDVAPTILYALGLPIPRELEGRVLSELFTRSYVREAAPKLNGHTDHPVVNVENTEPFIDAEGEAQVLMRLRALGYIE